MEKTYSLNDLAMMTGFTTRTLRNYLAQVLLSGSKADGAWQFTAEEVDRFFAQPYVKEGLRIKRSGIVFDFLAARRKDSAQTCVILDLPASREEGSAISAFFCNQMKQAADTAFCFDWDRGFARVILSGDGEQVRRIVEAYHSAAGQR